MSRKTDEELLSEMKEQISKKKKWRKVKPVVEEEEEELEEAEEVDSDDEQGMPPQPKVVERVIDLALINDKLNFIISNIQK